VSYTNKSASFTTSRSKDRAVFANTVLARQAIINGTNTINTKSVFGSPVGASLVLDQLVGSTETTPIEYNLYVTSVPTLPYVQGPQYYFILDDTNTLVGYTGILPAILTIPTSVNSRPVLAIGDGVFAGSELLVNITISPGIISIGNNAFQGCISLVTVSLPDGLTSIGNSIFQSCSALTTVTLPTSLTSIGSGAFNYCTALTSITVPALITSLPDACFGNCISLATVSLPSGLGYIGNFTFAGCTGLNIIIIPASVYYINSYGFYNSGLLSITFGSLNPPTFGSGGEFYTETYTFQFTSPDAVMYIPNEADNATWVGAVKGNNVGWAGTVVNLP
jgi:BspA type Leucine rich repeat region (6 copies)